MPLTDPDEALTVDLWKDLITLIAVVDPIGTIPIYLTATPGMSVGAQRKVAIRATLIAAGVLTAFIVVGQIVLDGMGISLSAYQVAGGIVLFLFALQMVFDPGDRAAGCRPEQGPGRGGVPGGDPVDGGAGGDDGGGDPHRQLALQRHGAGADRGGGVRGTGPDAGPDARAPARSSA